MLGVYFESWSCPWTSDPKQLALAKIPDPTTIVFISFCNPDCKYSIGKYSFERTGLDFSMDFKVVQEAISILKKRGIAVFLAVGGATFSFDYYKTQAVVDLAKDLGVDGLDLDWEPVNGIKEDFKLGPIIAQTKDFCGDLKISLAGFVLGCMEPNGDTFRGLNLKGLKSHGHLLDFVNIMNYDGGKSLDVLNAYLSYKQQYTGKILFGFQVGKQGWGDALLTIGDVENACQYLKKNGDGIFVWAYFKQGDPNTIQVLEAASKILKTPILPKPQESILNCPNCKNDLIVVALKK
jgi:chitinase